MKLYTPDGRSFEVGRQEREEPPPEDVAIDTQIADGTRIKIERDPEDEKWDLITIRVPNIRFFDPSSDGSGGTEICDLRGIAARWRLTRTVMSIATSIGAMFGAPPTFTDIASIIYREARTQEVLMSMSDEEKAALKMADTQPKGEG